MFISAALLLLLVQDDSANGGRAAPRWTEAENVPQKWLSDVFFLDDKTGWGVTVFGGVSVSSNGGKSWTLLRPDVSGMHWCGVWFLDAMRGFAVSGLRADCDASIPGKLLETNDGGRTWTDRTTGLPPGRAH